MNFFEQQERARKKTTLLVVLFVLSVISIVVVVDLAVLGIARVSSGNRHHVQNTAWQDSDQSDNDESTASGVNSPRLLLASTAITLFIILGGSAYKMAALSGGGPSVAQLLGGRPLNVAATDNAEAMLQNIVEEMAIASGVPVPRVYILDGEEGINAFAAGYTTSDAVIGITRGALTKLNRDELQGVIAHEFSHILNGDMKLNLRLIGILSGIFVVSLIGSIIVQNIPYAPIPNGNRQDNNRGSGAIIGVLALGVVLYVIGAIGAFFGRLIQAAVSRQREYLADASAVQFTRNPLGIVSALKKLGSHSTASRLKNAHSLETAHMFFADSVGTALSSLLATHPPLEQRIRAIDPTFDGHFDELPSLNVVQKYDRLASSPAAGVRLPFMAGRAVGDAGRITPRQITFAAGLIGNLPPLLISAAREPFSVRAVLFALLINNEPAVRQKQMALVQNSVEPPCYAEFLKYLDPIAQLPKGSELPLLDLCFPALRQLSSSQAVAFQSVVRDLIQADSKVTLFEYSLNRLISKQLASLERRTQEPMAYFAVGAVRDEAAVILSALASASTSDTHRAFETGARQLDPDKPLQFAQISGLEPIELALRKLCRCSPPVKQRLITAFATTIAADGEVNVAEAELLRAVAATMDVPIPPLLTITSTAPQV